jgi:uncharacterized protein YcgI (DUF1989 family)
MRIIDVPAAQGRGFHVPAGGEFRIVTPKGQQAADFFAFSALNVQEWLSPNHTWVWTRSVRPKEGDVILSRFRRPMIEFAKDGADGMHDMMIAACDQFRYEQLGHEGLHASCSENLRTSMQRLGHQIDVIPQPINFFTNTIVESDGHFISPPNPVQPKSYVRLRAAMDVFCVVSSCPYDLELEDWPINAPDGPTELVVEILEEDE